VIIALKNLMAREGLTPKGVEPATQGILKAGRSALVTSRTTRRREELGLPPLTEVPVEDMRAIVSAEGGGHWEDEEPES
jgi:hypothetical protein